LGEEPHLNVERYAEAFFDVVEALEVQRVVALGGVYGAVPYDLDRQVSCSYSLPAMKRELSQYAVKFSNYEGGTGTCTYLTHKAEQRGIEFVALYAVVPFFNFGKLSSNFSGIKLDSDPKAWYDLMKRVDHMFSLELDLSTFEARARRLVATVRAQIDEIDSRLPHFRVKERIDALTRDFVEMPFSPLSEVWERELGHLFGEAGSS
jgi:proteasome assembly chaperone (PAC2) family protein